MAVGGGESVSEPEEVTVMVSDPLTDSVGLLESVAFICTVWVSAVVGVPLTTQAADKVRPEGKLPPVCRQL